MASDHTRGARACIFRIGAGLLQRRRPPALREGDRRHPGPLRKAPFVPGRQYPGHAVDPRHPQRGPVPPLQHQQHRNLVQMDVQARHAHGAPDARRLPRSGPLRPYGQERVAIRGGRAAGQGEQGDHLQDSDHHGRAGTGIHALPAPVRQRHQPGDRNRQHRDARGAEGGPARDRSSTSDSAATRSWTWRSRS